MKEQREKYNINKIISNIKWINTCIYISWGDECCFFLFPSQAVFPPLRSSFFLHLAGLCPPIFCLFICSCVWIEPSTSASGATLKKEREREKNDKVQFSWAAAPEGSSRTRQRARRALAFKPIVLDPVWGGKCVGRRGRPRHVPEPEAERRKALWEHITLKRGKSDVFDPCKGVQTVPVSKERPQSVDKHLETLLSVFQLACF